MKQSEDEWRLLVWFFYSHIYVAQLCTMQYKDQEWTQGNEALRRSFLTGTPVRVCRGTRESGNSGAAADGAEAGAGPSSSPSNKDKKKGGEIMYVYDGLYRVKEYKRVVSNTEWLFVVRA